MPLLPAIASFIGSGRALGGIAASLRGSGPLTGLISGGGSFLGSGAFGVASEAGASRGAGSLLADLVKQSLAGTGGKRPRPAGSAASESAEEERRKHRRRMPSAADLFDFRPKASTSASASAGPPSNQASTSLVVPNANREGTGAQQNKAEIDRRRQEEKATESLKKFTDGILKATGGFGKAVSAMLKINLATYAGAKALEMFVGAVSESRRDLGRWNGSIAASFAQLDIRRMQGDIKTAEGVSGSTAGLNAAYGELLQELQPLRQDVISLVNGVGIVAANVGRVLAIVSKYLPFVQLIHLVAGEIEENTVRERRDGERMRDVLDALTNGPRPGPRPAPAPIEPKAPLPPII